MQSATLSSLEVDTLILRCLYGLKNRIEQIAAAYMRQEAEKWVSYGDKFLELSYMGCK